MSELVIAFCSGLMGSGHCVGMCGPFAIALGTSRSSWKAGIGRQLLYGLGRTFTYSCAGLAAAFAGSRLKSNLIHWMSAQVALSLIAGVILIAQALIILYPAAIRWSWKSGSLKCQSAAAFRMLLTDRSVTAVFLAGVLTGLLPCALVYANLALAARSGNLLAGALTMGCMGLGTIPLMALTGLGGHIPALRSRQHLIRWTAILLLATGIASIYRASCYWAEASATVPQQCPMCLQKK